jgi:hypothetical protein
VTPRKALAAAILIGVVWGGVCCGLTTLFETGAADFQHAVGAARDLLAGRDPYAREPGPYWIPYPLPAGLLAIPLAALPDSVAAGVFMGSSVTLLAWGVLRRGEAWRLAMLFSWPFLYAVLFAQWSPLLCAMWFLPWLAPLVLCKPNIALPLVLTGRPRWASAAVGAAVLLASLALKPDWPWVWLAQTRSYQGMTPPVAMLPLGPLILLSLFSWRERRAWLVLTLAVMPQRVFYDQLPLLLAAETNRELFVLVAAGWVSFLVLWLSPNLAEMPGGWQLWIVAAHYLPAVFVVARSGIREQLALTNRRVTIDR